MSHHHPLYRLFSLLTVLSMLLSPLSPLASTAFAAAPSDAPAAAPPSDPGVLFRTTVTLRQPIDRTRLDKLGVTVLETATTGGDETALVLVTADQLATLARLGFDPRATDSVTAMLDRQPTALLAPLAEQARTAEAALATGDAPLARSLDATAAPLTDLRAAVQSLSAAQLAAVTGLTSNDDDADGLTNTQEIWWCTDPANADSDGDGVSDGDEVAAAKAWLNNWTDSHPASGKPFLGWPPLTDSAGHPDRHFACADDDYDSVPDQAETWDLGLNPNRESTDRDKFDDGQELFGTTNCPGSGGFCGYGVLPRNEDWGTITAQMPAWVKAPGNHPLVAAFPVPEVDVVESSFHVQTVETVTTDHTIITGTEKTYSTAKTDGTSTSTSDTVSWSDWQEVSTTTPTTPRILRGIQQTNATEGWFKNLFSGKLDATGTAVGQNCVSGAAAGSAALVGGAASGAASGCVNVSVVNNGDAKFSLFKLKNMFSLKNIHLPDVHVNLPDIKLSNVCILADCSNDKIDAQANLYSSTTNNTVMTQKQRIEYYGQTAEYQDMPMTGGGTNYSLQNTGGTSYAMNAQSLMGTSYYLPQYSPQQLPTMTSSSGHSTGGAQTTTTEQYQEHTVTNGEAFSNQQSWSTATAVDSAHAADLWFTYVISNTGDEYAREIADLAFNIYLGDDPNPAYTYFVAPDVGGDGKFHNFMPGESHTYTSQRIPLTLEQMKTIDLGGPIRIVLEDYTYGIDELFYQDAVNAGVQLAIEDGVDDGDEAIDTYLIPTWGNETVLDVLGRYFPHTTDADGDLIAVWTPEPGVTGTPNWCTEPQTIGTTLWCQHSVSLADWWNIYTNNLGDGTQALQNTTAMPNSTALFRFNKDTDLDGYSDRSETKLDTDPADPASHPTPGLLTGMTTVRSGSAVTGTLAFLNTGNYDAYGVEAVMIAPDDSISITNNTVGGSGRVKAGKQVIVGSRILPASYTAATWSGTAVPFSGGYYLGDTDRVYTFTAQQSGDIGAGTLNLNWNDGAGASGALNVGAGYASPSLLDVGTLGLKVGLQSGTVTAGDVFTIETRTPRDTFQYTINRTPYTPPMVVVSYNDPQGNHRFVTPITLTHLTDDLLPYQGQMLENPGVEIVTTGAVTTAGVHSTTMVLNNPWSATLEDAHVFMEFVNITGTVAAEFPVTVTVPTGPTVVPVTWDTSVFSPTFQTGDDYIVMAFFTDYQGNIIDTAARPLSSFQPDPAPQAVAAASELTWDFGTAAQGTLLKHDVTLANAGFLDLLAYVSGPPELTMSQRGSTHVNPADANTFRLALNTDTLPTGAYSGTITIRTGDAAQPAYTIHVTGNITAGTPDTPPGAEVRPLDWMAAISGDHNAGEWVTFAHTLAPDPQSLHPVRVYSADYATLFGVGKYATDFSAGTASADMFGDGRDGVMPSSGNLDNDHGFGLGSVTGTAGSTSVTVTDRHAVWRINPGDAVLIHQTQGSGAGNWEMNTAVSNFTGSGTFTLQNPLQHSYGTGAQIMRVPQYSTCTVGGTVTPLMAWNGTVGGIFAVKCNGTMTVNGTISANGYGYRGGPGGNECGACNADTGSTGGSYPGPPLNGPSTSGVTPPSPANGGGGRGGSGRRGPDVGAGGGGGSYGSSGTSGQSVSGAPGGSPGATYGSASLSSLYFGSGGGGGGKAKDGYGGDAGSGGGAVLIYAASLAVEGQIVSNGQSAPGTPIAMGGGGGGGSGGSIRLQVGLGNIGTARLTAYGGSGHDGSSGGNTGGRGGNGGVGRVYIEYCNTLSGSTNPVASTQKLNCYITEQVESAPYTTTRLNLPETFTGGRTYAIQYGRRLVFSGAGNLTTTLRIPAGMVNSATLDALISNITNGAVDVRLDVGSDGTWDWTAAPNVSGSATVNSPELATAFNAYWSAHGAPTSGTLDIPLTVYLGRAGQVLLTNARLTPSGSSLRAIRLPARNYDAVTLNLSLGDSGSGAYTVAADVGDDGSIDWSAAGNDTFPLALQTGNLAGAVNAYLSGKSGEVDVPVRLYVMPALSLKLTDFSATPTGAVDVSLTAGDISFGAASPTEGETVPIHLTIHNSGSLDSDPLTAAFFANLPGWGNWYLGSAFVPAVPAGGSAAASLDWHTLGYTGTVPVRVEIDPYNRITETLETNNVATQTLAILTRPDMRVTQMALSDDEPVVGETVTVTLTLRNNGQTTAGSETVALFDGNPDTGGTLLAGTTHGAQPGSSNATLTFTWTPTHTGAVRLFGVADLNNGVAEYDEGNNQTWQDVYIGVAGPVLLDSGAASDVAYSAATGYGVVDTGTPDIIAACNNSTAPEDTYRSDPDGSLLYRFDHLQPGHSYHLDVTLYDCNSLGQQETITVDGVPIAGPEDLGDTKVHRLSLRLDPALYADRAISVTVTAPGIAGAVVNEMNLHDIDYRYADAGGGQDPAYGGGNNFGWLDGVGQVFSGTVPFPIRTVRIDQTDNELRYQFDGLKAGKNYNLHLTFWQNNEPGPTYIQRVQVDGLDTGLTVDTGDYQLHQETVAVSPAAYSSDGSIVVGIIRNNAPAGAMVNEIALEEETQQNTTSCSAVTTPYFSRVYGNLTILGVPAPVGTVVQALNPRGDTVGCFTVSTNGLYGSMQIFGEAGVAPGMRDGEIVAFKVNGAPAVAVPVVYWHNNPANQNVNLTVGSVVGQSILMNPAPNWTLFSMRVEPPVPTIATVLNSIDGKYDSVLGETDIYVPSLPEQYNGLKELHAGKGYYISITSSTTINALLQGVTQPVTTPIALHQGWNWIGYYPEVTWPLTQALQSIDGHYQFVSSATESYDIALPPSFNQLNYMSPGEGYLLYANDAITLTYPAGAPRQAVHPAEIADTCGSVAVTPYLSLAYGHATINGHAAPVDTRVEAVNPQGQVVGCTTVQSPGLVKLFHLYGSAGQETARAALPSFSAGDALTFRLNGIPVDGASLMWQDDRTPHEITLDAQFNEIYLPLIFKSR